MAIITIPANLNVSAPTVTIWLENPLAKDFNPCMMQGQKIFLELTQGPLDGKRFSDSHSDLAEFIRFLCTKSYTFGTIISNVPDEFNNASASIKFKNII